MMVTSGVLGVKAINDQADATQRVANNNAVMADYAANDAQVRGEEEAMSVQRRAASLKSSQRVSAASKGLDLGYGTTADLQDQTDFFAQSDAATARTNAGREAWRSRTQAQDFRAQGAAAKANAGWQTAATVLGTASQVADKWRPSVGKGKDPIGDFYQRGNRGAGD